MSDSPRALNVPGILFLKLLSVFQNLNVLSNFQKLTTSLIASTALLPVYAQEPPWNQGGVLHITQSIDSSSDIALEDPLTLNIDAGQVVRLSGQLSGPRFGLDGLSKSGVGRLELLGDNRGITRQVILREGTLHVGGRYALGPDGRASLQAHAGSTLSYAPDAVVAAQLHVPDAAGPDPMPIGLRVDHGIATQAGTIFGTTPLIKQGPGTLWLSGAAPRADSQMIIAEGSVHLANHFSGRITITNATLLSGNGRVGWLNVGSGGILAPTGQMVVDKGLHFDPDSALHVRIGANGVHDSLHVVHGPTELNGHVLALPQGEPKDWQTGVDAVLIQTADGLGTSRFTSVDSALPYLEPELHYDSHNVTLQLRPRRFDPERKPEPEPEPEAEPEPVQPAPKPEPEPEPLQPGHRGSWAASLRSILQDDSRFIREAVYTDGSAHNGFWGHAFHSFGDRRGNRDQNGDKRRISGLLLGVNKDVSATWRLGIYGGASHTDSRERTSFTSSDTETGAHLRPDTAKVHSAHLGLSAHHHSAWDTHFTLGAAHSWDDVRSQRSVTTPWLHDRLNSRYRVRSMQVFAKAEHPLWTSTGPEPHTRINAFASTAWVQTRQSGHTERGGPLALHLPSDRTSVLFNSLGLSASHTLEGPAGKATLTGSVAWRHAGGDTHASMHQTYRDDILRTEFTTKGLPVARNAWQLQLGMQGEIGKQTQLGVYYSGQHGDGRQDHGVQAGLTVRW